MGRSFYTSTGELNRLTCFDTEEEMRDETNNGRNYPVNTVLRVMNTRKIYKINNYHNIVCVGGWDEPKPKPTKQVNSSTISKVKRTEPKDMKDMGYLPNEVMDKMSFKKVNNTNNNTISITNKFDEVICPESTIKPIEIKNVITMDDIQIDKSLLEVDGMVTSADFDYSVFSFNIDKEDIR